MHKFYWTVASLVLVASLPACDYKDSSPGAVPGDFYLTVSLNGEPFHTSPSQSALFIQTHHHPHSMAIQGTIGVLDPPYLGKCDPYPCKTLSVEINGHTSARPGELFEHVALSHEEGLNARYYYLDTDVSLADWSTYSGKEQPRADGLNRLVIAEFDTTACVAAGTFDLTLFRTTGGLPAEELEAGGLDAPVRFAVRDGRFRLPIRATEGPCQS
jgi:hypothetical protein